MITPRTTRLLRVPDLTASHRAIAALAVRGDPFEIRARAVIVPTRSAARQLQRTLEDLILIPADRFPANHGEPAAYALPYFLTRDELYGHLHAGLPDAPPRLSPIEREVLLRAAAADAIDAGDEPPFKLRPGLVVEILSFYESLGRQRKNIDDFERLTVDDLEAGAALDRGAERMLRQTRFLVSTFRAYERRVAESGRLDENGLRRALVDRSAPGPLRHVVLTVPDGAASPAGLCPADFDLLARLPGLDRIDIIVTENQLAAGFHERLMDALPGIEEERWSLPPASPPVLRAPGDADGRLVFVSRDREEELRAVVGLLKTAARSTPESHDDPAIPTPDRTAVVFQRPLPYLYLTSRIFEAAGVPYQTLDALPLAIEPYAAALQLVFDFIESGFGRAATIALLRSPLLRFHDGEDEIEPADIEALNLALTEVRFLGGEARLLELAEQWDGATGPAGRRGRGDLTRAARAARAAAAAAGRLRPLSEASAPTVQLGALLGFLRGYERLPRDESMRERHLRARAAILGAIEHLGEAFERYDLRPTAFGDVASTIRRWIEDQTFAPVRGSTGVHLLDAQAAAYGEFDEIRLVGLIAGEWPLKPPRNIFYPSFLLAQLGWPLDQDLLRSSRAGFLDLLRLPGVRVSLSSFTLEEDAIVSVSPLAEEIGNAGLPIEREPAIAHETTTVPETLAADFGGVMSGLAREWLALRQRRSPSILPIFHGQAGAQPPRIHTVTSVDRYLQCPFKYFAAHVLRLEEEREAEETLGPLARGRFLHDVFREFFERWRGAGQGAITAENLDEARAVFAAVVEWLLPSVPEADREFERCRLLGSAAATGIAERALRLEAERPVPVIDRLIEYSLDGEWTLSGPTIGRSVALRGKADRIDLFADGTFRLIDYKTGNAPDRGRAIQLPVYAACVSRKLQAIHGHPWTVAEAGYLAFGERQGFVPLASRGADLAAAVAGGQERFLRALERIETGDFPPRPSDLSLCETCGFVAVCRKDYVAGAQLSADDA